MLIKHPFSLDFRRNSGIIRAYWSADKWYLLYMGRFNLVTKILNYFRISLLGIRALLRHNPFTNKVLPVHHTPPNTSTSVERALQINLFMQNEPKSQKSQVNVTNVLTIIYENWTLGYCGKNEPKRTQNEPKPKNAKMKLIPCSQRTYRNFRPFGLFKNEPKRTQNEPKSNPTRQLWENPSACSKNPQNTRRTTSATSAFKSVATRTNYGMIARLEVGRILLKTTGSCLKTGEL